MNEELLERVWKGSERPIRKGEIVNQVYETDDYFIFKFHKRNRTIMTRPDMLKQAKEGIVSPIIVNGEMIVIDGQNRLHHSMKVGAPVKYIIDENLSVDDIARMNTNQEKWNLKNWVESYANSGNEENERWVDIANRYYSGLTVDAAVSMNVASTSSMAKVIRESKFIIEDYERTIEFFEYYTRLKRKIGIQNYDALTLSLFQLFRVRKFDGERLINKIISTNLDEELRLKNLKQTGNIIRMLDAYNESLKANSKKYINYYITSKNTVKITDSLKDWAKKKTADSDQ